MCYVCLFERRELRMLFRSVAEHYFGIPKGEVRLRELRTPPWNFPRFGEPAKESVLVSFYNARELGVEIHGGEEEMHRFVFELQSRDYEVWCTNNLPRRNPRSTAGMPGPPPPHEDDNLQGRISLAPVMGDLQWMEDFPFFYAMRTVTSFPWFDAKKERTERGVWCRGCRERSPPENTPPMPLSRSPQRERMVARVRFSQRAWTETEFVQHAEDCVEAMAIWNRRTI